MSHSFNNRYLKARTYLSVIPTKTKWLHIRRKALMKFYPWIPRQLMVGVTYKCQCRCPHCVIGSSLNKNINEMTSQEIYNLIKAARRLGLLEICYFGGEPLLRDDIIDLIRFTNTNGLLTSIFTNGIRLTQNMVRDLKNAGLSCCNVSLDSASPAQHNRLRGFENCFEKAVEGIKYILDEGIKCNIWTYVKKYDVEKQGLRDLKAIIDLGRHIKVNKVIILFPIASGKWLCNSENILTLSEREMVRTLHNPPFVMLEFPREDTYCPAGKRMVYVTPNGDLSPCPTLPYFFGNIRHNSLRIILKKFNREFIKQKQGNCGECIMNTNSFRDKLSFIHKE